MRQAGAIGVPSGAGMKDALVDFGLGMGGALVYALGQSLGGNGFIGALLGAVLAGSVIKGTRGEIIATILGFQALSGLAASSSGSTAASRPVV